MHVHLPTLILIFFCVFTTVPGVLSLCDWVRDEVLVDLGVRLEDKTGGAHFNEPRQNCVL